MSMAANSWSAFMDQLLILGDYSSEEQTEILHKLVDIYYDAVDAPKSGKKVVVPHELRAKKYPHYMEKQCSYTSTSVLGLIYDMVKSFESEDISAKDIEVWKLPCFETEIPRSCFELWRPRYVEYRRDMSMAMKIEEKESKEKAAEAIINHYKQLLYNAAEFEVSPRNKEDVYNEALAIYHIVYDYAKSKGRAGLCSFAWKVAGQALFKVYSMKQKNRTENPIICSPSVLCELLF